MISTDNTVQQLRLMGHRFYGYLVKNRSQGLIKVIRIVKFDGNPSNTLLYIKFWFKVVTFLLFIHFYCLSFITFEHSFFVS